MPWRISMWWIGGTQWNRKQWFYLDGCAQYQANSQWWNWGDKYQYQPQPWHGISGRHTLHQVQIAMSNCWKIQLLTLFAIIKKAAYEGVLKLDSHIFDNNFLGVAEKAKFIEFRVIVKFRIIIFFFFIKVFIWYMEYEHCWLKLGTICLVLYFLTISPLLFALCASVWSHWPQIDTPRYPGRGLAMKFTPAYFVWHNRLVMEDLEERTIWFMTGTWLLLLWWFLASPPQAWYSHRPGRLDRTTKRNSNFPPMREAVRAQVRACVCATCPRRLCSCGKLEGKITKVVAVV